MVNFPKVHRLLIDGPEPTEWERKYQRRTFQKGRLFFETRGPTKAGEIVLTTDPRGTGSTFLVQPDQVEPYRFGEQPRYQDFGDLFEVYLQGLTPLPNMTFEEDVERGLDSIAAGGGLAAWKGGGIGYILFPYPVEPNGHSRWSRIWLGTTQGGHYDGSGIAIVYRGGRKLEGAPSQIIRFKLCPHTNSRSWSGGRCYHRHVCDDCGLDMSVDSSD